MTDGRTWALLAVIASVLTACGAADGSRTISRAEVEREGKTWPFRVSAGRIGCDQPSAAWFESEGKRYALNGTAKTRYPYVEDLLKVDEGTMRILRGAGDTNPYVVRIDPADVRFMALDICRSA